MGSFPKYFQFLNILLFGVLPLNLALAANYCVDDFNDGPPNAADCPVDCIASNGICSLRDAIEAANADAVGDTILLPQGVSILSETGDDEDDNLTGDIDILNDVTIEGAGADISNVEWSESVSADNRDRVFDIDPAGNGIAVLLQGLTVANGIVNQNATLDEQGGAGLRLNEASTLNAQELYVQNNLNQVPSENGGGMLLLGQSTLNETWISENQSTGGGGGIALGGNAIFQMTQSTVSGNQTTSGGIAAGGLFMPFGSQWTISNSTISGNTAQSSGGGFLNDGDGFLENVTITANTASSNTGGGLRNQAGDLTIRNSIIAQNTAGGGSADCDGQNALVSEGSNLIGDGSGCTGLTDGVNQDQVGTLGSPINALLDPLANNGGQTPTHFLQSASPALNAVDAGNCPPPNEDQRGQIRPIGTNCDIGSVEVGQSDLSITLSTNTLGPVQAGTAVTYSLNILNEGPEDNFNIEIQGQLPGGAVFQGSTPAGLCTASAAGFICTLSSLANGQNQEIEVVIVLNSPGNNLVLVTVTGSEPDPNPSNNSASLDILVEAANPIPDFRGGGCSLQK